MINLDVRLKSVYDMIGKTHCLVDVGSDHGYLPIRLLNDGKIEKAVVTDVNEGPLLNAKENFMQYNLSDRAKLILSDGLKNVSIEDVDVLSICGMGGELIISILDFDINKSKSFDYLVLQPMNSVDLVRRYLYCNGFSIVKEDLVKDRHHFYNVLKVTTKKDNNKYDDVFFDIGYNLYKNGNKHFCEYLDYKINVNKKIIENCGSQNTINAVKAKEKAAEYINILERIRSEYESKRYNKVH